MWRTILFFLDLYPYARNRTRTLLDSRSDRIAPPDAAPRLFRGIILNVMPCVLPVLSLKLFSLVEKADLSRRPTTRRIFPLRNRRDIPLLPRPDRQPPPPRNRRLCRPDRRLVPHLQSERKSDLEPRDPPTAPRPTSSPK